MITSSDLTLTYSDLLWPRVATHQIDIATDDIMLPICIVMHIWAAQKPILRYLYLRIRDKDLFISED